MDFWEELKKNLASAVDAASRGAVRLTGEARMRINIASAEKRVDDAMKKLGQLRYDELKNGADNESPAESAAVGEIDSLIAALDELKDQRTAQRSVRRCRACGEVISQDAVYCSRCGEKQE